LLGYKFFGTANQYTPSGAGQVRCECAHRAHSDLRGTWHESGQVEIEVEMEVHFTTHAQ
jgi:hypothetical protein